MAEYIDYTQATTLFGDVDARFDTVEGKIPSNASSGNKMVTASDIATKADLVDGKVPAAQLPSFVDDVLEYASTSAFPATGESGKIYVALDTNKTYRWGGSDYVEISESLALGETSSTAYAGDKGKANADAISDIQDLIPSSASSSNKLATAGDIPTVPTTDQTYDATSTNPQSGVAVASAISGKADTSDIPTALADLTDDSTHRVVTDTEKTTWSGKQDALTFDELPTPNSNNPVKSKGIRTAIDVQAEGDYELVYDSLGQTGKNLLPKGDSSIENGITFLVDDEDGTVSVNGTASATTFWASKVQLKAGLYYYSGCADGGADDSYKMDLRISKGGAGIPNTPSLYDSEAKSFSLESDTEVYANIRIQNGYTCSNLVFYPMLTKGSVKSRSYEMHHEPISNKIDYISTKLDCVNKVPKGSNREASGITYTVNNDGTVTANGTASGTSFWGVQFSIPKGSYKMTGCPIGGSSSGYSMDVRDGVGGSRISGIGGDEGSGTTFTRTEQLTAYLNIRIASGTVCNNLVFKPMIRESSITDDTYHPYNAKSEQIQIDTIKIIASTATDFADFQTKIAAL